jgi:hypothetical protein
MTAGLVDRYNLVQSTAEVKELLRAVLLDSNLYDRFVDDSLYQGLANC